MVMPTERGGAKALLLTVLGEFVLPAGGQAWTSTLVAAAGALGLGEKNARQALSRISDQGLIEGSRHGRTVRWSLTGSGRELLETGTRRIYDFGTREVDWDGQWLVAHCPVAESQRSTRNQLRTELSFLGFGELSPSLLVSPHVDVDPQLRAVLERLDLLAESTVLWANSVSGFEDEQLVAKAWDLDKLGRSYVEFSRNHRNPKVSGERAAFREIVYLVHDWRRFPFTDPELPTKLLPANWAGTKAVELFHSQHTALTGSAKDWFNSHELQVANA